MSRPWGLCRVCSLISRINFRSRSKAGKIKFFLTSGSSRGLWRPALYIGPGAGWGQGQLGAGLSREPGGAGQPAHCRAKLVLPYRERRGVGLGNPGDFQWTPSQAPPRPFRCCLGLEPSSGRKTFPSALPLGLLPLVRRGSRCGVERETRAGRWGVAGRERSNSEWRGPGIAPPSDP